MQNISYLDEGDKYMEDRESWRILALPRTSERNEAQLSGVMNALLSLAKERKLKEKVHHFLYKR